MSSCKTKERADHHVVTCTDAQGNVGTTYWTCTDGISKPDRQWSRCWTPPRAREPGWSGLATAGCVRIVAREHARDAFVLQDGQLVRTISIGSTPHDVKLVPAGCVSNHDTAAVAICGENSVRCGRGASYDAMLIGSFLGAPARFPGV